MKQTIQLVKAGFNYRFNGSGVPVDKDDDDPAGTLRAIASTSVGKESVDASVAGIFALTGTLDKSGPRLYLTGGTGRYQFGGPDALVTGIYSTKPGTVGRRQTTAKSPDEVPMAMMGIVPTKVSAENGAIRPGDLLVTAAKLGYAMRGTDRSKMLGAVIGKALGNLYSGTGVIEVVVTLQ